MRCLGHAWRAALLVSSVEPRRRCDGKKSITWAQGLRREYSGVLTAAREKMRARNGDRVGLTLPTLTSLVEGACCQYKRQERTGARWQTGGASFSVQLKIRPRLFSSVHPFPDDLLRAFRLLFRPQQDAMCFHSLTPRLAWPWPTTSHIYSSSQQQHSLPTTTSTPHVWRLL